MKDPWPKIYDTLEHFVKCAEEAWVGIFPSWIPIFFGFFLSSCTGKTYYRSADRTWFILLYLSVQSYLVSQFCFRKLFWKLFWKCRFIQLPALEIKSPSFTQPVLALVFFCLFKVNCLIACMLTKCTSKITVLNFGLCAKTPLITPNTSELFLRTEMSCQWSLHYFIVQEWQCGGKQSDEPSCLSFLLNCSSAFIEECTSHLEHAVHTNSR